ncbi:N-formylglutamate amidohydrolase [Roseicyclus sp. F158]|uniref:N-formylglutamate amidohydrolase n=1 Tax=Tropicimonas omnivorans TaxID=3075590 RepID=A0ABU3DKH5_9RHOB|nr:N-formylglutamate amidohydrolase [Roseicyclus sp. F158]MDT0684220.1 N-formylglutamate amidohydrolase [Roseicyclus sp. F158]
MARDDWTAAHVIGPERPAALVVACEHASCHVPPELSDLGLDAEALRSHIAWDIGAAPVARLLGELLDAPVVEGAISRLVYDCNRPLPAPDAIPERSEIHAVPGNASLTEDARRERFDRVHAPYHDALAGTCAAQEEKTGRRATLLTIHSFTPVYNGMARELDLGFLHDATPDLAEAACRAETLRGIWRAALNEPYSAADGVTHTLKLHGEEKGRPALMIEIRNDLIADDASAERMARHLAETLKEPLALAGAGAVRA